MFDRNIRPDGDPFCPQRVAEPHCLSRPTGDETLIGNSRAAVNIDANSISAASSGDREGCGSIVAKHVDTQLHPLTDSGTQGGDHTTHRRHSHRWYLLSEERDISKVLDHQSIEACLDEGPGIPERGFNGPLHRLRVGSTRQRTQVDHSADCRW